VKVLELKAKIAPTKLERPAPPVTLAVPPCGLERTQDELRALSNGVRESLVLWAGHPVDEHRAQITHVLSLHCPAGALHLVVPRSERLAALAYVRQHDLLIFADLHTHPAKAFLSEADRARPFGSRDGFYAIVVPDFARGIAPNGWAMYEAQERGWCSVDVRERISS
jgi:hypothetical protein